MPASSRLAYGFWRYQEQELETALSMIERARAAGIDHLDMADVYGGASGFGGAERLLGALRRRAPNLLAGASLATKAGVERGSPYNSSPAYLRAACEASLKRLGVEQVDLFCVHRPDLLTHPEDLAEALDGLVRDGKAAQVGVSNFTIAQVDALKRTLKAPLSAIQIEVSAAHVAPILDGALDQAMREKLAVYAWSPLAGGRLFGTDADLAPVQAKIAELAQRHGVGPEAVALAFLLRHPARIMPIIGTKSPARLEACLKAEGVELARADWYAVLEARLGRKMP